MIINSGTYFILFNKYKSFEVFSTGVKIPIFIPIKFSFDSITKNILKDDIEMQKTLFIEKEDAVATDDENIRTIPVMVTNTSSVQITFSCQFQKEIDLGGVRLPNPAIIGFKAVLDWLFDNSKKSASNDKEEFGTLTVVTPYLLEQDLILNAYNFNNGTGEFTITLTTPPQTKTSSSKDALVRKIS